MRLSILMGFFSPFLLYAVPAFALNVIPVTTTADSLSRVDGQTSLREAVQIANTDADDSEIQLVAEAFYSLTLCGRDNDTNLSGDLDHFASDSLTITGAGATIQMVCAGQRVLHNVMGAGGITLTDLTLTGGDAFVGSALLADETGALLDTVTASNNGPGVAISGGSDIVQSSLTILSSDISGNTGPGVGLSFGGLTITGSTIQNNGGDGVNLTDGSPLLITDASINDNGGHGVRTSGQGSGLLSIDNTTISGNSGSGVVCDNCGDVNVINNSLVTNNTATFGGGGLSISIDQDELTDQPIVTVSHSMITNNSTPDSGAGISVRVSEAFRGAPPAQINITDSIVNGNTTTGGGLEFGGGGLYVETGQINVTDADISDNLSPSAGGGILAVNAVSGVTLTQSTIDGNTGNFGGGLTILGQSAVVLVDRSTISNNTGTARSSGGIFATLDAGTVTVRNATISGNSSASLGGGISTIGGVQLILEHATVVNNTALSAVAENIFTSSGQLVSFASVIGLPAGLGPNCQIGFGGTLSNGYNVESGASCGFGSGTDLSNVGDVMLGPLADNGGPTFTHLPVNVSPAIGSVPAIDCTVVLVDQHGMPRPLGPACERGAVEIDE